MSKHSQRKKNRKLNRNKIAVGQIPAPRPTETDLFCRRAVCESEFVAQQILVVRELTKLMGPHLAMETAQIWLRLESDDLKATFILQYAKLGSAFNIESSVWSWNPDFLQKLYSRYSSFAAEALAAGHTGSFRSSAQPAAA